MDEFHTCRDPPISFPTLNITSSYGFPTLAYSSNILHFGSTSGLTGVRFRRQLLHNQPFCRIVRFDYLSLRLGQTCCGFVRRMRLQPRHIELKMLVTCGARYLPALKEHSRADGNDEQNHRCAGMYKYNTHLD